MRHLRPKTKNYPVRTFYLTRSCPVVEKIAKLCAEMLGEIVKKECFQIWMDWLSAGGPRSTATDHRL